MGLDAGGQNIELLENIMEVVGIMFYDLHRLQLLEAGFLGNLVFAFVGIALQVAYVRNVAHVAYFKRRETGNSGLRYRK